LAIAKLEAAAGARELALATERGKVLDLPSPLKRVSERHVGFGGWSGNLLLDYSITAHDHEPTN
jgi:hypothetical protein